jgi:ABC-2 type transport system permease protein
MMNERIVELVRKELKTALREPRLRTMLIVPPIMQLLVFGFAVNLDVEKVRLAVMDNDRSTVSRELVARFQGAPRFALTAQPASPAEADRLLDEGRVEAVLEVLPGFGERVSRGTDAAVLLRIDGSNSNTASIVGGYANGVFQGWARDAQQQQQRRRAAAAEAPPALRVPQITAATRIDYNPELKSRFYFVPGVIVNIVTLTTLSLTALAIVREKEVGTMEQLMVTPLRPLELIIGKTLPFGLIGLAQLLLISVFAFIVFRIPFRGSLLVMFLASTAYLLATLGVGLFVSTISRTQQQATMGTFFFIQPAFMLSGFTFPVRNMPEYVQWLTWINPQRWFMEVTRGIFLKGSTLQELAPQIAMLFLLGTGIMLASVLRFRRQLN